MNTEKITINTEYIKADQFLKLMGIACTGSDAKVIINEGEVKLNGSIITERGKKIRKGDKVEYNNVFYEIC